jgi:hypothetical protein
MIAIIAFLPESQSFSAACLAAEEMPAHALALKTYPYMADFVAQLSRAAVVRASRPAHIPSGG